MANKETIEVGIFTGKVINSLHEEGQGFSKFLDDIIAAPPAFENIGAVDDEAATMTNEEKQEVQDAIENAMPDVPAENKRDISDAIMGAFGIARLFWRRGLEAGRQQLINELKTGAITLDQL